MNDRLAVLMVVHRMFLAYQNPSDAAKLAFLVLVPETIYVGSALAMKHGI